MCFSWLLINCFHSTCEWCDSLIVELHIILKNCMYTVRYKPLQFTKHKRAFSYFTSSTYFYCFDRYVLLRIWKVNPSIRPVGLPNSGKWTHLSIKHQSTFHDFTQVHRYFNNFSGHFLIWVTFLTTLICTHTCNLEKNYYRV